MARRSYSPLRPARRRPGRVRRPGFSPRVRAILAVAVLAGAGGVAATVLAFEVRPSAASNPVPVVEVNGTIQIDRSRVSAVIGPQFWGANTLVGSSYGANETAEFQGAGLSYAVWPGGRAGDAYNISANFLAFDDGGGYSPSATPAAFIAWCRAVHCHAIFQLPAEIDAPAVAAYEVAYVEHQLGFHPDYWEVGNEPALWTHFGLPWSEWSGGQARNATPGTYADVVHAYNLAVRAVDPQIRLIGLPGVGQGGYNESTWIRATVRENGPNLSALAIHVYPAGLGAVGNPTLGAFYATLQGSGTLSARLPIDRAAVRAACPTCPTLPILVTELGSATVAPSFGSYLSGFPQVPYLAAEIVQGLETNATNLDVYALESTYLGALLDGNAQARPLGTLYRAFFPHLGPDVLPTTIAPSGSGLFAVATRAANGSALSLLLSNTNVSADWRLLLTGFDSNASQSLNATCWSAGSAGPGSRELPAAGSPTLDLPPASVCLVQTMPGAGAAGGAFAPATSGPILDSPPVSPAVARVPD